MTVSDFYVWVLFGIIMASDTIGNGGKKLWGEYKIAGFIQHPSMKKFMPRWIF